MHDNSRAFPLMFLDEDHLEQGSLAGASIPMLRARTVAHWLARTHASGLFLSPTRPPEIGNVRMMMVAASCSFFVMVFV